MKNLWQKNKKKNKYQKTKNKGKILCLSSLRGTQ
jgi:hypothetical protein